MTLSRLEVELLRDPRQAQLNGGIFAEPATAAASPCRVRAALRSKEEGAAW